jgi:hypothetical protein
VSTFRYRLAGVSPEGLDTYIEAGSGASTELFARPPWTTVTLVDDTREPDLDEWMSRFGYVPDSTGPVVVVSADHTMGTESIVLVNATGGPVQVDIPLTAGRLGDELVVMKIDGSANAVTVTRTGADTIDGAVTQVLGQQGDSLRLLADEISTNWHISASRRARDITFDSSGLPTLTAVNVQDAIGDVISGDLTSIQVFTSGEALTAGDLLTLNSSGDVVRAVSSIGSASYEVIGVSSQTVGSGVSVQVVTHTGAMPNVRFTVAPAAAFNGRLVFLSASTGLASTSPPVTGGNVIFTIGTLQGADGATSTPVVVFRPQLIALRS